MINHYSILNVAEPENVTDEIIKQHYDKAIKSALSEKKRLEKSLEDINKSLETEEENKKSIEDRKLIIDEKKRIEHKLEENEEYIQLIQDAYAATKNEHARNNLKNLQKKIQDHMQIKMEADELSVNAAVLKSSKKLSALIQNAKEANEKVEDDVQLLKQILDKSNKKDLKDVNEEDLDR